MRKIMTATLALLLCLAMCVPCASAAVARYEGNGFDSPEKATRYYLEGLKEGDLGKMLGAFAIETYVEGYDFAAQLERLRAYVVGVEIKTPNLNDFFQAVNVESRKAQLVNYIFYQVVSFQMPELDFTRNIMFGDDAELSVEDFVALLSTMEELATQDLEVTGFIAPEQLHEAYLSEANQRNIQRQADIYGADEMRSMVTTFTANGQEYIFCCDVARYGNAWYLISLSGNAGNLLGISVFQGGIMPAM